MRSFVAVELSDEIKAKITEVQEDLRQAGSDAKWVKVENIHVTLRFLGELHETVAKKLSALLFEVQIDPFDFELKGVGSFPESGRQIRVVWVGCRSEKLLELYRFIEGCTKRLQLPPDDKGFTGHATIARVRSPINVDKLREKMTKWRDTSFGIQKVSSFTLFESQLTPQGPIYSHYNDFNLKEAT